MELIFATGNIHKLKEAHRILGNAFTVKSAAECGITEEIPENADTLEGNALQKCRYLWGKTGKACIADDTGLFVDALGGEPGIRSARYAGEEKRSEDNVKKLLDNLKEVPVADETGKRLRTARFICSVALMLEDKEYVFTGQTEGEIALEPSGKGGFGYDPVFISYEAAGEKKFSEISAEEKNAVSHRGKAMRKLAEFLKTNYDWRR